MTAHLVDRDGSARTGVAAADVEERLGDGSFFWLDLHDPSEQDFQLLRDAFGFHPLAVEDSEHFGQRPKLEPYDDFAFLVVYGAAPVPDEDRLVEVHCFYSERFLVTVRRDEAPSCDAAPILVLHEIVDGLVDSFMDLLSDVDDRLDALEDAVLEGASQEQLGELFAVRRRLTALRRAVLPQRDVLARVTARTEGLPGMTAEARRYFRDVYDHLIRVSEAIENDRDVIAGVLEAYVSSTSNRLNQVTKQLTLVATIFLPLTFITGFFGQNFGWMVDRVFGWPAFVGLGIGLELATVGILVLVFRRFGWI